MEKYGWMCIKGDCDNGTGTRIRQNYFLIRKGQFVGGRLHGKGFAGFLITAFEGVFRDGLIIAGTIKTKLPRAYHKYKSNPKIKITKATPADLDYKRFAE